MGIEYKPLDQITEADLQALVEEEVREGRHLDYKESLPTGSNEDRKEFLSDICSLVNAGGGDLIYGVKERRDDRNNTTGLAESFPGVGDVNLDQEKQALENRIRSGIAPRIPGVAFRLLPMAEGGNVLIVRVPRTWTGPHTILHHDWMKFYSRNSSGKCPLDVQEIRTEFLQSERPGEFIRDFQADRLGLMIAGETTLPVCDGPKLVLHLVPFTACDRSVAINFPLAPGAHEKLQVMGYRGSEYRFTLEGEMAYSGMYNDGQPACAYTQLFGSGIVEAVRALDPDLAMKLDTNYEREFVQAIPGYFELLRLVGISAPFAIMVSAVGVRGYGILRGRGDLVPRNSGFDRDVLPGRPIVVEDEAAIGDSARLLRPCFDAIWRACGYAQSLNYDGQGTLKSPN